MKKKYVVILLAIMLGFGIGIEKLLFSNDKVKDGFNGLSQVKHENMLSMMLEQTVGAGDYQLETRSTWPTQEEDYVFNSTLSKCENGSKLSWNGETRTVVFSGSVSDKCYVYFDKYQSVIINSSSATVSGNSIVISINATAGTGEISKYHYSKDNGQSYVDSTSNTYTFKNLIVGDYVIKYYVEDTNGKTSEVITKQVLVTPVTLANWVKLQYTGTQGGNNLYYHDSSLSNGAGDNSYRYAGSSDTTNNFVCFGTDETTCPDDNLYRIIGAFGDQVKLIKWDYANSDLLGTDGDYNSGTFSASNYSNYTGAKTTINRYYWNSGETNTWGYSKLNTVNLNTNYINNIGTEWSNKIAETTWKVGGTTYANVYDGTAATAYINEYINPAEGTTYKDKIALMYTSDYGFAAGPSAWTANLFSYDSYINDNWMYMGIDDWTVVRRSDSTDVGFLVNDYGMVVNNHVNYNELGVRPVFYLNSDVTYVSGSGTKSSPIRIN